MASPSCSLPPVVRPYRVSTITWNGSVGCPVNYAVFFEHLQLSPAEDPDVPGFVWADFHGKKSRGTYIKKRVTKSAAASTTGRKAFDNQVTVLYRLAPGYIPNVKLFYNGNIHVTGIRANEDGIFINEQLVKEIRRIHDEVDSAVLPAGSSADQLCAKDFKIRMINSDFSVPYRIRRKDLHKLLMSPTYNNKSVFQPGSYPGVKLQFYWNENHSVKNGICACTKKCLGKGDGKGDGDCKKVTVAIFESGSILITGANAFEQIDHAHAFITKVLKTHGDLQKILLPTPGDNEPERPVVAAT